MRKVTLLVLVLAALCSPVFADEPAPDANPCYLECKQGCYDTYAADLNECSTNPYPGESYEDCADNAHGYLLGCKQGCNIFGAGCGGGAS